VDLWHELQEHARARSSARLPVGAARHGGRRRAALRVLQVEALAVTATNAPGLIAVDKMGGKVLFLDPKSYVTTEVLDDFERNPHELLIISQTLTAYVPIFGNGVHGRNPKPGHLLSIVDLKNRTHAGDIDLSPLEAPHGLQLAPDGLIYVTCENSGLVAIVDHRRREVVGTIPTGST